MFHFSGRGTERPDRPLQRITIIGERKSERMQIEKAATMPPVLLLFSPYGS